MNQEELIPKVPPTEDEVMLMASKVGLPIEEAYKFWYYYQANGWKVGRVRMKNWHMAMIGWKLRFEQDNRPKIVPVPLHIQLRAVEELLSKHPANPESTWHKTGLGSDQAADFSALKEKRERLLRQIAAL